MRLLHCILLLMIVGCGAAPTTPPPDDLSLDSFEETMRWLRGVHLSLDDAILSESQLLGQKDRLAEDAEVLRQKLPKYSGKRVNWRFEAFADEGVVRLFDTWEQEDDSGPGEVPGKYSLIVSSKSQEEPDGSYPLISIFELAIPDDITREEAKKLPETVTVQGTISEVRLEKAELLLGGIYLTVRVILEDITLVP